MNFMYNTFMLKIFRKKIVSKIILWGLLILILPAFVMWGNASMSRSKEKGPKYAGRIDDKKVSLGEFYGALAGVRSQIILNYFNQPKILDSILGNKPLLAKIAWDRLIMVSEAKKLKIKITDKDVIKFIQTHPLFSRSGAFDDKFYAYILRNNIGLEPRAFEEMVRENISMQKLVAVLAVDLKVSEEEIADEYKKEYGKIKIEYLFIEPKGFLGKVKIQEADVKDFYEKNKGSLIIKSNLKGAVPDRQATFGEARETIENHLKEAEAVKRASKESGDIYKEVIEEMAKKGKTFGKAALKFGYAVKETPFFLRTDTLDNLGAAQIITEAAAAVKDFEISKPVETSNGIIIFQIVERQIADEEKFKKEKEEYAKKVREMKSNLLMEEWLKKAEDRASLAIKLDEVEKHYR